MELKEKIDNVKLSNGQEIPISGLGTFSSESLDTLIFEAIKLGVRLIDTAWFYNNEDKIGLGLKRAIDEKLVTREEITIVTKLYPTQFYRAEECLSEQLKNLQVDYIDVYLIHWSIFRDTDTDINSDPVPLHKIWLVLESFVEKKLCRSIGVSNFNVQLLSDLLTYAVIKPVINQIEYHPYLQQPGLIKFCNKKDIAVMAYNSLVSGTYSNSEAKLNIFTEPIIIELAQKHNKLEGQIILNWAISKGIIVIPKSSSINRIKDNLASAEFRLPKEDIEKIDSLEKNYRFLNFKDFDFFA